VRYDPDSDVWSLEFTESVIVDAREIGGAIVHFSDKRIPVLIEILDAGRFMAKKQRLTEGDPLKGMLPALP